MQFRVLECKRFTAPQSSNYAVHTRLVKDFEIDIELSNGREYSIGDKSYHIKRGDMCIRFPGQVIKAKGWQDSYILTLDFSQKTNPEGYTRNIKGQIQQPIPYDFLNTLPNVISFDEIVTLKNVYEEIISYADKNDKNVKILVEELLYTALARSRRIAYHSLETKNSIVDLAVKFIKSKFHENIRLEDIASHCHVDKSYLIRAFKKALNKTPFELIIDLRLEKARDLVLSTTATIEQIAIHCGYKTTSFFIKEYKKRFGVTPSAHRK